MAKSLIKSEQYDNAVQFLHEIKTANNGLNIEDRLLGAVYLKTGKINQAYDYLCKALETTDCIEVKKNLARVYEIKGAYPDAEKIYLDIVRAEPTFINHWMVHTRLCRLPVSQMEIDPQNKIKIALLSNNTIDPVKVYLDIKCRQEGLCPTFYLPETHAYKKEILSQSSNIYSFQPDVVIMDLHGDFLFPRLFDRLMELSREEKCNLIKEEITNVMALLEILSSRLSNTVILIHNFARPELTPFGLLEWKHGFSQSEFYNVLNENMAEYIRNHPNIFILDFDRLTSNFGKMRCINSKMRYRSQIMIDENLFPYLAEEYMRYIRAIKNLNRECLILDLDNILWGGNLEEDGIEGIRLGGSLLGEIYLDFQWTLLQLCKRGVNLAVSSKNDHDKALRVIDGHPAMVLRSHNFAIMHINQKRAEGNIRSISRELGIPTKKMVFISREQTAVHSVQKKYSDILAVEMPEDPAQYVRRLATMNAFDFLSSKTYSNANSMNSI